MQFSAHRPEHVRFETAVAGEHEEPPFSHGQAVDGMSGGLHPHLVHSASEDTNRSYFNCMINAATETEESAP